MITIKKYVTKNALRLSLQCNIGGVVRTIKFGGADSYTGTHGSFTTKDEAIQAYLESSPLFGKEFVLDSKKTIKETVVEKEPETNNEVSFTVEEFKKVNDAKLFLMQKFGAKAADITSKQKCIDFAKERGVILKFNQE